MAKRVKGIRCRKTARGVVHDVRYRDGAGVERTKTFDRLSDAVAFKEDRRRQRQRGAFGEAEPSRMPMTDYLEEWFRAEQHRWKASTRKRWGPMVDKWIAPYVEGFRLCDFGTQEANGWFSAIRRDGASVRQANYALTVLSSALGHAHTIGRLPYNPCRAVRKLPEQVGRRRALTPLEVERLRAEMPSERDRLLLEMMAYAGLRPEEALPMPWGNVLDDRLVVDRVFTHGALDTRTKTNRVRDVRLVEPLAEDLQRSRPDAVDAGALVAPGRFGQPLDLDNWRWRVWRPAAERAGVDATPGDCRHTFASLLANEGRLMLDVARELGHTTPNMLQRYAHLFDRGAVMHGRPMAEVIYESRDAVAREVAEKRHTVQTRAGIDIRQGAVLQAYREAGAAGIEPATLSLEGSCSIH
jgi:integrase